LTVVYEVLHEDPKVDVAARLDWLVRDQRGYAPQPYEQLAAVYRKAGRDEDARRISIAKQRARRRTIALPSRLWKLLLDILVGYGYRTWLAGLWLLAWWAVGTLVFAVAYPDDLMLATRCATPRFPTCGLHPRCTPACCRPQSTEQLDPSRSRALARVGGDPRRLGAHHRRLGRPERDPEA
jgi:hypothetical protein